LARRPERPRCSAPVGSASRPPPARCPKPQKAPPRCRPPRPTRAAAAKLLYSYLNILPDVSLGRIVEARGLWLYSAVGFAWRAFGSLDESSSFPAGHLLGFIHGCRPPPSGIDAGPRGWPDGLCRRPSCDAAARADGRHDGRRLLGLAAAAG